MATKMMSGAPLARALSNIEREEMIVKHAPLVRYVVGRLLVVLPQVLDKDDLLGYGTIGLIEAVDRFDPAHGVSFEAFASDRIKGAVIDALRAADWVPRTARKRARDIQRSFIGLEEQLGRPPSEQEVASELGLTLGQMHRAMADATSTVVSLQRPVRSPDGDQALTTLLDCVTDESAGPSQEVERRELHHSVIEALRRLDEREQLVLSLYYEQGLTLREIGKVMDICESRVWQLHARAIMRIRAYVETGQTVARKGA